MVVDPVPLQTLLQFYDPELRCFTFQDYQLAPTLEEYSILLNVPIRYQVPFLDVPKEVDFRVVARSLYLSIKEVSDNWKSSGDVVGLPLKYLVRMAKEEAKKGNWEAFHAQLATMIYGIVLHGKGGAIRCCLPLLLRWFLSLLPVSGPFVDTQSTHKWTQRIMSLTSYDIRWQSYQMDVRNVIMSCGEFRNVPLIGTKGCINYNPVLSLRQMGFVINGRPLDAEIAESVYFEKRSDPARLEQVGRAWKTIGVKDGAVLGKKFAVAMPDYIDWVKSRVETLLLPYDRMESLQEQPPLILAENVPAEHYKQALMENRRLKEKEQDTQMELYKAKVDKLNLAHQLKGMQGEDVSRLRSKKRSYEEIEAMLDGEHRERLRIADQRPHRYATRLNQQRNMDQVQAELAEMRANMAQFMHMVQGVAQGQEELRALVQRQEAAIPPVNHALPEGGPINDPATAVVPINNYAVGDELRGIRINGQPIAPETANARETRAPVRHPAPLVDRQEDMFTLLSEDDEVVGRTDERDRRVDALAKKIRAMECQNSLGFDVTNIGLVEGLRIPYKFKAPSFDKYNGTSCPRTHVQAYFRKISAYTDDEKMWMYFF
ncbi:hypothetical protein KIW84_075152 [Lathyrus oleraceus]|uniref:DUF7745 domain-containing protein n=1 Tax=Pisum sativum TaxID=3888 RepID=A0A9D4VT85_PEA|nr:hypothetical protein KIW84_075152 [Pisum sativum]